MTEEVNLIYSSMKESMNSSIEHLDTELSKIRTGKASPAMFESVKAEYYGASTPISQLATINTLDAKTIVIKPFDKGALEEIEKGIFHANLGLTPQNDGETIMISIPALTEERRREFVKRAKDLGETCKISLRSARKDALDMVKKMGADGLSEDNVKDAEAEIQNIVNGYGKKVDEYVAAKEKDVMTI